MGNKKCKEISTATHPLPLFNGEMNYFDGLGRPIAHWEFQVLLLTTFLRVSFAGLRTLSGFPIPTCTPCRAYDRKCNSAFLEIPLNQKPVRGGVGGGMYTRLADMC